MGLDKTGVPAPITISIIPGSMAPRFDAPTTELTPVVVTITEEGMVGGRPMVDFKFTDPDGNHFAFTTSGRMIRAIGAAIAGINMRNHGTPDP